MLAPAPDAGCVCGERLLLPWAGRGLTCGEKTKCAAAELHQHTICRARGRETQARAGTHAVVGTVFVGREGETHVRLTVGRALRCGAPRVPLDGADADAPLADLPQPGRLLRRGDDARRAAREDNGR